MSSLKIMHWNCFKLSSSRLVEFEQFLIKNRPDIVSLQEIKFNQSQANLTLR